MYKAWGWIKSLREWGENSEEKRTKDWVWVSPSLSGLGEEEEVAEDSAKKIAIG